ncbi:MAG: MMPL family transporter [Acidobacteriota bacterium]
MTSPASPDAASPEPSSLPSGRLPRGPARALIRLGGRRPGLVLLAGLALFIVAVVLTLRLRVDADMLALMPVDHPAVNDFRTTVERFGATDLLLIAVELRQPGEILDDDATAQRVDAAIAYAERLVPAMRAAPAIDWVEYRLQDVLDSALDLVDRAPLLMTPAELDDALTAVASPDGLERRAAELAQALRSPLGGARKRFAVHDPFGLALPLFERLQGDALGGSQFDPSTGYLIDSGQRFLLMLLKPELPAADLDFSRRLLADLAERQAAVDAAWNDDMADEFGPPPPLRFAGGYAIALGDSDLIVRDMLIGAVVALVGVVVLFTVAFGRPVAALIAFVPLFAGLVYAAGFASGVFGRLNSATSAFAALLVGLGIDFVIVLYARYAETRAAGETHSEALDRLSRFTAPSVLLGAVTTAATFFAFLISDFRGLSDLGLLTGAGILLLVVTVFTLLPALLTWLGGAAAGDQFRLRAFGIDGLIGLSLRRPRAVLIALAVATVVFGVGLPRVHYDDRITTMRSQDNAGARDQSAIMEAFGLRFTPMLIRIDGRNEAEVLARAQELVPDVASMVDGDRLARVDGIARLVPDPADQRVILDRLAAAALDRADLRARAEAALTSAGLAPGPFAKGLDAFADALTLDGPLGLRDIVDGPLGRVAGRYVAFVPDDEVADDGVALSLLVYAYPPAATWQRGPPADLMNRIAEDDWATVTGAAVISRVLKAQVWKDAAVAGVLGLVLVFLLMFWDLGTMRDAIVALLPLLLGLVWMLGLMGWLGVSLNFLNLFVFTMIIGIGVDYGLHLLHRLHEAGDVLEDARVRGTGRAVVIAALTTMVGFGSLVLSHIPALRTMGAAAILGAASTAVLSLTLLPALAALALRRSSID